MLRAPARRLQGFQMDRTPRAGAIVTFIALGLGIGPTGSSQESADPDVIDLWDAMAPFVEGMYGEWGHFGPPTSPEP